MRFKKSTALLAVKGDFKGYNVVPLAYAAEEL